MSIPINKRLDYLDAVRSFALILGIIFHASLSFIPIFIGWAVMDISTSHLVSIFILISHSFRMELFFLIAGFFGHLKFHQQGAKSFFKSRFVRVVIPFIVGWFLLRPLLIWGWVAGAQSMQGDVNILLALTSGLESLSNMPTGIFVGTHLWFLYYLFLIFTALILLRYILRLNLTIYTRLVQLADRFTVWLCSSIVGVLFVSFLTACCLWFMERWGVDTPDKSLIPDIPVSLIYGGFFIFGWLVHRQALLLQHFSNISCTKILLCCAAIIMSIILSGFEANLNTQWYKLIKVCYLLSYAVMMWLLISLTLGVFRKCIKRSNKYIRYIADASYWLYLIHLPIVIGLQIIFAELPLHWSIKLISICSITIIISLIIYDIFVRSTFIGKVINGKQQARFLFNSNK